VVFARLDNSGGAGSGDKNIPAGHGFEAESGNFPNILLVVDDQNAS
jgi:hypothetical protein